METSWRLGLLPVSYISEGCDHWFPVELPPVDSVSLAQIVCFGVELNTKIYPGECCMYTFSPAGTKQNMDSSGPVAGIRG